MEESTILTDSSPHRRKRASKSHPVFVDDESSTDSGCSSRGSSGSNKRLSRRGSSELLCGNTRSVESSGGHCYLHRLKAREPSATRSQERLVSSNDGVKRASRSKSSRSWSPSDDRGDHHHYHHHHHHDRKNSRDSPSHSSSPSDAQSSDSDTFKRPSKTEVIRRALQCLKIAKWQENDSGQSNKEKKQTKKGPRRILRNPVSYTYVRGLSGLPTQRVPRNTVQQVIGPCSCHDTIGLHR